MCVTDGQTDRQTQSAPCSRQQRPRPPLRCRLSPADTWTSLTERRQSCSTWPRSCPGSASCEPLQLLPVTCGQLCPPWQLVMSTCWTQLSHPTDTAPTISTRHHRHSLDWLPIRQRVTFKTALLVWKCVHGAICTKYVSRSKTSSGAHGCIYSIYSVTEDEDVNGTAKFCVPCSIWNSLPSTLRDSILSLRAFKGRRVFGHGQ